MLPIKTIKRGSTTVKICEEDLNKVYANLLEKVQETYNTLWDMASTDSIVKGTGVAKLHPDDEYDEKVGDEIAFRRAKLKANLKKIKILRKVATELMKPLDYIEDVFLKYSKYINGDVKKLEEYGCDVNFFYK